MKDTELSRLIDAHLDGRLSASEAEALSQLLVRDADARRQFWEQTAVHGLLPEATQLEWLGKAAPEPERNVVRVAWWRWAVPLAAAAALVLLAVVWRASQPNVPASTGVALLSRVVGAQWADAADERAAGAVLSPGTLRLNSGAVMVEFYSGARVVLEGPAELELVSAKEAFLRAGKLSAHVPPPARGFTVGSPAARVVDLGTEFGLAVTDAATAEVHVFNGKVEVLAANAAKTQSLNAGDSTRLAGGAWTRGTSDRAKFLGEAELFQRSAAQSELRLAAWRVTSRAWSGSGLADDRPRLPELSLRLHYPFDAGSPVERVLTNAVAGAPLESHGSIVGGAWGEGRWPGKRALEFRSTGDRVRFTGPESFAQLTFLAWVRVEALPQPLHALVSADAERTGALRWELTRDGRLRLTVGRDLSRRRIDWEAVNSAPFVTTEHLGQWLLLATTFDGHVIRHYGNGRFIGEGPSFTPPALHLGAAELGNSPNPNIRPLIGSVDEFAVLTRALGAEEVREFYERGKP